MPYLSLILIDEPNGSETELIVSHIKTEMSDSVLSLDPKEEIKSKLTNVLLFSSTYMYLLQSRFCFLILCQYSNLKCFLTLCQYSNLKCFLTLCQYSNLKCSSLVEVDYPDIKIEPEIKGMKHFIAILLSYNYYHYHHADNDHYY